MLLNNIPNACPGAFLKNPDTNPVVYAGGAFSQVVSALTQQKIGFASRVVTRWVMAMYLFVAQELLDQGQC